MGWRNWTGRSGCSAAIRPGGSLNNVMQALQKSTPTSRAADLQGARPHVAIALQEAMAGEPVSVPTSKPYGCNVKY
jgi:hypothetical protein